MRTVDAMTSDDAASSLSASGVDELATAMAEGRVTWAHRRLLTDTGQLEIREVYTDDTGAVLGWTDRTATLWGIDADDLAASYARMSGAFNLPVLVETELPGYLPED